LSRAVIHLAPRYGVDGGNATPFPLIGGIGGVGGKKRMVVFN
jgi:hypothetical protein